MVFDYPNLDLYPWCLECLLLSGHSKPSSISTNRYGSSLGLSLATRSVQASRRFPQRDSSFVLRASSELPRHPINLSSRLDRILGLGLGPLRLTLDHVSLDDFKPEYTTFRTARPAQWSARSQVNDAWCEQSDFKLGSTSSDVFRTIHGATRYTAISYMWGSPEDTKTITINGMPVTVSENLATALDCLRSSLVDKV